MNLLTIDIGNSHITLGLHHEAQPSKMLAHWRIESSLHKTADEYGALIHQLLILSHIPLSSLSSAVIGSVVPELSVTLQKTCQKSLRIPTLRVDLPLARTLIKINYPEPETVGMDRLINAIAAHHQWGDGQTPLIVVDLGTATTFDVISAGGDFLGGAIAPGLGISARALTEKTRQLPHVTLSKPQAAIAKNTIQAIQAGLILGYGGLIDRLVVRIRSELSQEFKDSLVQTARVIATGGLASVMQGEAQTIDEVDEFLTLKGLCLLFQQAHQRSQT